MASSPERLNLPYEVRLWEFGDNPSNGVKGTKFLKINENGRVPALEDPTTTVISWDSGAIIAYLLRVYDTNNLMGPRVGSLQDHVDFDKWIYFLVSTLGPIMGQANWFRHYHSSRNNDALMRYEAQTYRTFNVLEQQLDKSGSGFILSEGFSPVDAHFYPWIHQFSVAQLNLQSYSHVKKRHDSFEATHEAKNAYKAISNGSRV